MSIQHCLTLRTDNILYAHTVIERQLRFKVEQSYFQSYRLMAELAIINNMPETVERAKRWKAWNEKAIAWADSLSQPETHPLLQLVQSAPRPLPQNRDETSQQALKT